MEKVKPGKKMTNQLPYNLNQRVLLILKYFNFRPTFGEFCRIN